MPAYNVASTLERTVRDMPPGIADEILLIDDGCTDDTACLGKQLGLTVIRNGRNRGYGYSQRIGQIKALEKGADVVVMLHPDYQYDPRRLKELITPIIRGEADLVFGSRMRSRKETLENGMPYSKYILNRIYMYTQNYLLHAHLSEYFSGYRAFSQKLLTTLPLYAFSDNFVYDQELMISALAYGFTVAEIPVPVRYFREASSMRFLKGVEFLHQSNIALTRYLLYAYHIYRSPMFIYRSSPRLTSSQSGLDK
ncbi:glycosyltransferase family 2 protein [Patescibacteria group bacterium]|nr:glycosyltransferase family 2 protein [Patescibacteria group bacterium]